MSVQSCIVYNVFSHKPAKNEGVGSAFPQNSGDTCKPLLERLKMEAAISNVPDGQIRRPDDVLIRLLGDESVLLNLASESYFGLDEVGTRMWCALEQAGTVEGAYRILIDEYDVEPEKLRADLATLVDQLSDAGLVEIVGG